MKYQISFAITLCFASSVLAQYRCIDNGKVTITDRPCADSTASPPTPAGNAPKIIGDQGNSGYTSLFGDWRGQVQYQASYRGAPVADAHAIIQTTISIDPQGKISGLSPENGCKLKGIAAPGLTKQILNLDITLSNCNFTKLNRRLGGTLALYPAEKQAQFWIYAIPVAFTDPGWSYDIKGTMRR